MIGLAGLMLAEDALAKDGARDAMVGNRPAVVVLALGYHGEAVRQAVGATLVKPLKLPKLTIRNTQKYIAAVAAGVENGQLAKGDANSLLYAAQMLLAAHRYQLDITPPAQVAEQGKRLGFVQAFADTGCEGGYKGGTPEERKAAKRKTKR